MTAADSARSTTNWPAVESATHVLIDAVILLADVLGDDAPRWLRASIGSIEDAAANLADELWPGGGEEAAE